MSDTKETESYPQDYWWDAWKRTIAELYTRRDEIVKLRHRVARLREENAEAYASIGRLQSARKAAADQVYKERALDKITKLQGGPVQVWLDEVAHILGEEIDKHGPYFATAEQYVLQSRAAAETARKIGAKLDHWQGFKFVTGEDGAYRETYNPTPGGYTYIPSTVPSTTEFAIGGKTMILPDGAMGFYGTETTTVKITDDVLSRGLGSLLGNQGQDEGSEGSDGRSRAGGEGIGQQPEISAAVTILDGCRITLKLKVGRDIHEVQTFLVARPAKS